MKNVNTKASFAMQSVANFSIAALLHATLLLPFGAVAFAQEAPAAEATSPEASGGQEEAPPAPTPETFTPPPVKAERRVAVFVLPAKKGDEESAKVLQTVLRESVEALNGVIAVDGVQMPDVVWAQQVGEFLAQGDTLLNEDVIVRPAAALEAQEAFKQALTMLEANPGAGDNRAWAHTFKGLAVAAVLQGNSNEGYKYMKTSLNLYPLQSAIEYGYSISAQTMYERIIQDQSVEASGELQLTSVPSNAEVRVDGKRKGFADPIRVSNLEAGSHRVSVQLDGYFYWEELVEIPSGGVATVVAELEGAENWGTISSHLKGIARKVKAPKRAEMFVDSLKASTDASEALVVTVGVSRQGQFVIRGIQSGDAGFIGGVTLEVARDGNFFEVLRQFVEMQFVATTEVEGAGGPLSMPASFSKQMETASMAGEELTLNPDDPLFETEEESDGLLNQWWFWTAIGVGVAGAAAAVAIPLVLADDGDKGKGPTGAVQLSIQPLAP